MVLNKLISFYDLYIAAVYKCKIASVEYVTCENSLRSTRTNFQSSLKSL